MNSYVIPMDFDSYTFSDLLKEWKRNKHVLWKAPGDVAWDENENPYIKDSSHIAKSLDVGDVIYIYVCNLPSESAQNKARILLRGTVKQKSAPRKYNKVYYSDGIEKIDKEKWEINFAIDNLITLKESDLKNDFFLSREYLEENFDFINPQGNRWPNTLTGTLDDRLIRFLEKRFDETTDFLSLINHFNKKCYFSNIKSRSHKTFLRRSGTDYFEYHHLIQQKEEKKHKKLKPIIHRDENIICLCPNCHRMLHSGRPDEVVDMLRQLWNDKDVGKKIRGDQLNKALGVDNDKEAFNKLLKSYYID